MKLKCLIVDDEPSGRKVIEEYISETDFLDLAAKAENPVRAMSALSSQHIDLMFLDVQMPKINGIDFLRSLRTPPMVILTTAFSEYAFQGFEMDVIDYLLKPISLERFLKACNKARDFHALKYKPADVLQEQSYFFVKCSSKFEKIQFDDLLFVEAANNYVLLHTREKRMITYLTFKGIEEYLPASQFIRVHKSFIVSLPKIESIDGEEIRIGKQLIPISRSMKDEVLEKVISRKLLKR